MCYSRRITNAASKQKALFEVFSELSATNARVLPSSSSDMELAAAFSSYFYSKIEAIHNNYFQNSAFVPDSPEDRTDVVIMVKLNDFRSVSQDDVDNTIKQSNSSSCLLDSVPSWLLKRCSGVV